MEGNCPNCGYRLVSYRTDRQAAGRREVVLKWSLCPRCRHVALESWSFGEPSDPDESDLMTEPVPGRTSVYHHTSSRPAAQ
jgi:endogenous inhibitor of DNA gyrase (YacG/DUF329 family)